MHENILPLLGTAGHVYATHGCDAWVCPWMENGTLETYLGKYPAMALQQKLRLVCYRLMTTAKVGFNWATAP
jgi:hypothetical protein